MKEALRFEKRKLILPAFFIVILVLSISFTASVIDDFTGLACDVVDALEVLSEAEKNFLHL